ncbi:CRISPR-associated protein Cas5 [Porphyromonas gingivicanis]|uniref:CRISPR-associated protein Cas5 n=1 Tax=Porphyromonas gingivicanis TaxID=266762 RepID=UPI00046F0293|nr:CRISPR-associated protein Cas5 [Porphyromonas gingivicanis]
MKGFLLEVSGEWAHFKRPETNNNPLSHDLITKTALIGVIGAVLGIERREMKSLYPQLSEDLLYGVQLINPLRKLSWGFTSKTAINPTEKGTPKYFEFLKNPSFLVALALKEEKSEAIYSAFQESIEKEYSIYPPVLGWHNCPANLQFRSEGCFSERKNGLFETQGFISTDEHILKNLYNDFRVGFDKLPTFQNDDFWNLPERYVQIVYPEASYKLAVEGPHYTYKGKVEQESAWYLI